MASSETKKNVGDIQLILFLGEWKLNFGYK